MRVLHTLTSVRTRWCDIWLHGGACHAASTTQVTVKHEVTYYDPLEVFGEGGNLAKSGAEVQNPHFFLKEGQDKEMDAMRAVIKAADCYIVCSAEYVCGVLRLFSIFFFQMHISGNQPAMD